MQSSDVEIYCRTREKSKDRGIWRGKKVFNPVVCEYAYKGREIAGI